ncbi:hypothetical protein K402DRAFT_391427 [Aulographum hederae CBS 113979]|uniref:Uncharacterized protein n=1 Tax=Aulographum hederae CBS 113979 TaxID=1176131 RepID=A0A6G1H660_9PEZI|nr:hypothetical protein K402DRAFT_391427 [Aulographum hederae CBS 113979]
MHLIVNPILSATAVSGNDRTHRSFASATRGSSCVRVNHSVSSSFSSLLCKSSTAISSHFNSSPTSCVAWLSRRVHLHPLRIAASSPFDTSVNAARARA